MGAEPCYYFVPYRQDVAAALDALRKRESQAGRYNPAMPFPSRCFPLGPQSPAPVSLYGTSRPGRAQVEPTMQFLEDIERGHAVYMLLYVGDTLAEILFAGFSYD